MTFATSEATLKCIFGRNTFIFQKAQKSDNNKRYVTRNRTTEMGIGDKWRMLGYLMKSGPGTGKKNAAIRGVSL
jgi:hypothetical protein